MAFLFNLKNSAQTFSDFCKVFTLFCKQIHVNQKYVPKFEHPTFQEIERLRDFISASNKLCVITGAGVSTESGIPDYRSKDVGLYDRANHRPMQHSDFIKSEQGRQRYWARNYLGWKHFQVRKPNKVHKILADWEESGKVHHLVTQNVDSLHTKAGSKSITELHGCMSTVICLNCEKLTQRSDLQIEMEKLNSNWFGISYGSGPDADDFVREEDALTFTVPSCSYCGGTLKPDVVFFGDNVKKTKVLKVYEKITESDALLILGSSLFVWSGFRFILHAQKLNVPIACVNIGPTRADDKYVIKISSKCSHVLSLIDD